MNLSKKNKDNELVTLTMTREQASTLELILLGVYLRGINEFEGVFGNRRARYQKDKRVLAASRSFEKLTDARRKSVALDFELPKED